MCGTGSLTRSGVPKGRSLCSGSMSTADAFLTSRKTIGQSSLPSPRTIAGIFPAEARDIVIECCLKENGSKFDLHTVVVMPDHTHLLLSPLRDADGWNFSLPQIMHALKGVSARKINLLLARRGPVWQEEFFDHVLRSNDSLAEKVDYMCQNPVRAGLAKSAAEYRWLWRGKVPVL